MRTNFKLFTLLTALLISYSIHAQKTQYSRAASQTGINVFEPGKVSEVDFDGLKLQIGGNFRQSFQMLKHENIELTSDANTKLYPLGNGFNLAAANLNFDVQLDDGIRMYLENYIWLQDTTMNSG